MFQNWQALETDRLRLRLLDEADAAPIFAMYSDPHAMRYLLRPRLTDAAQAAEMIGRAKLGYADGTSLQLGIERKSDRALVGMCLLFHFHEPSARAEIGYILGREHWRQGYVGEALPPLVDFGFRALGLNRIEADIDPRNVASARVLGRLGFTVEGLLRERWTVNGAPSDSQIHGLLRREWRFARA